jgi:hypothetical protein
LLEIKRTAIDVTWRPDYSIVAIVMLTPSAFTGASALIRAATARQIGSKQCTTSRFAT